MKLSEMKNKVSGLPDGFVGVKMSWDEVNETFQIVKACVLERDKINEKGEKDPLSEGSEAGTARPRQAGRLPAPHGEREAAHREDQLAQAYFALQRRSRQGARLRQQVRRQDLRRRASGGRYALRTLRAEGNEGRPRDEVERRGSRGGRVNGQPGEGGQGLLPPR